MKVCIVNQYAGIPGYGKIGRGFSLAKALKAIGHDVTLITSSYCHHRNKPKTISGDFLLEEIEGVKVCFVSTKEYEASGISRVVSSLQFSRKLTSSFIREAADGADWVIEASAYGISYFSSLKLSKLINSKFAYEVRDLWPLNLKLKYPELFPLISLMLAPLQKFYVTKADLVISNLSRSDEYFSEIGGNIKSYLHVSNGYVDDLEKEECGSLFLKELDSIKRSGGYIIGYSGSIGSQNAVDVMLKAACYLNDINVYFVIIGDGSGKIALQNFAKENSLNNVLFYPMQEKSSALKLLRFFDLGWIGGRAVESHKYGVSPNKVYDYLACNVDVLYALDAPVDFEGKLADKIYKPKTLMMDDIVFEIRKVLRKNDASSKSAVSSELLNYEYTALAKRLSSKLAEECQNIR